MDSVIKVLLISADEQLREVLEFCLDGWGYDVILWESHRGGLMGIKKMSPDVIVIDVHAAREGDLEICTLLKNDFVTSAVPTILLINKRHLKSELLNLKYGVDDYLIKPPDPLDLRIRIEMAIRRSQFSLHASPLTGLPGGRTLEEMLKERLKSGKEFSVGYLDIDNFKSFNDVYGYVKGDSVIMQTAYMLHDTVSRFGNKDDFVAHIGGDDFIFISTPDKYEAISENFISRFDSVMPFHYRPEDRKKGFVTARDRTNKVKRMPLMSVSVAVVNVTRSSKIDNIIQINELIAEIKKYLKEKPGSKYMSDRRTAADGASGPRSVKASADAKSYKPLGQRLVDRDLISDDKLEEALRVHWKRGVVLGDVLKDLGLIGESQLDEVLSN